MDANTAAACIALGRIHGFDEEHCRQDARLALRLFDLSSRFHALDSRHRDLLEYAALLHDIGYVEGYVGHHKAAYQMILQADLPGLSEQERHIVANVARYHRGARPTLQHRGFAALTDHEQAVVRRLSAILRLADGLDRTHTDAVRYLEVTSENNRFVVLVSCPDGCAIEAWAGTKKGRFFGELFGVQVEVRVTASGA